jgi:ELWxxDGT repeat protein
VTDGTPGGTTKLKSFQKAATRLTPFGSKLAFAGCDADAMHNIDLCTSDGSSAGTIRVASAASPLLVTGISVLGSKLLITANASGSEAYGTLYILEGGSLKTLGVTAEGAGWPPAVVGGEAFFAGCDATNDCELYKTNGTLLGTKLVKDINGFPGNSSSPQELVAFKGEVYFSAKPFSARSLFRSDGAAGGTVSVGSVEPRSLTVVGDKLFFTGDDGTKRALWARKGDTNTKIDIAFKTEPQPLGRFNDLLLFKADDGKNGSELYKSDGTTKGTSVVAEIGKEDGSSDPVTAFSLGDKVWFVATDHGKANTTVRNFSIEGVS